MSLLLFLLATCFYYLTTHLYRLFLLHIIQLLLEKYFLITATDIQPDGQVVSLSHFL